MSIFDNASEPEQPRTSRRRDQSRARVTPRHARGGFPRPRWLPGAADPAETTAEPATTPDRAGPTPDHTSPASRRGRDEQPTASGHPSRRWPGPKPSDSAAAGVTAAADADRDSVAETLAHRLRRQSASQTGTRPTAKPAHSAPVAAAADTAATDWEQPADSDDVVGADRVGVQGWPQDQGNQGARRDGVPAGVGPGTTSSDSARATAGSETTEPAAGATSSPPTSADTVGSDPAQSVAASRDAPSSPQVRSDAADSLPAGDSARPAADGSGSTTSSPARTDAAESVSTRTGTHSSSPTGSETTGQRPPSTGPASTPAASPAPEKADPDTATARPVTRAAAVPAADSDTNRVSPVSEPTTASTAATTAPAVRDRSRRRRSRHTLDGPHPADEAASPDAPLLTATPEAARATELLPPGEETTATGRRPGAMMSAWLTLVAALGCVLGAAALPPGVRCSNPNLILPASFMLLAALPSILGLYYVDTLRSVRPDHDRWAAATGSLRTFLVTWSFCLPLVLLGLVLAVMQAPLPDQSQLFGTGIAVLGVGALARLMGEGSADLHREHPGHPRFTRWLKRIWRTHPWVTVYLALAVAIGIWASFSPLAC